MAGAHLGKIQSSSATRAIKSSCAVDITFLRANPESVRLLARERESCHADFRRSRMVDVLQLYQLLRLGEHIEHPGADGAVCTGRDEIVRVLRADELHAIHRMSVSRSGQRCLEYRQCPSTRVPHQDLPAVRASDDEIRMEG